MKVVILSSLAYSLVNFRGALLASLVSAGHEVVACAPDRDPQTEAALADMGVRFRQTRMDRTGTNPFADLKTLFTYVSLLSEEAPDLVLAYTQKPIIYGGIACRLTRSPARFHALVTGLGHVFSPGGGIARALMRRIVAVLYRLAVRKAAAVYVFNRDDPEELWRHHILPRWRTVIQLPGSGVDTTSFTPAPLPGGPVTFLLIARLMRDKGLSEFAAAAEITRETDPAVRFQIVGPLDPNPTGISHEEIARWRATGHVDYLGETRDVRPFLAAAHVFVLPSYYREGLPRTILEAMACGRAVITTDMPGCCEPITIGENGLLVPPRDPVALARAMQRFVADPRLIAAMGARGRAIAEQVYDVRRVNRQLIGHLESLPSAPRRATIGVDAALAAIAIVALLPLMAVVGLLVLLILGRPLLFRQARSGLHGVVFEMIKFRTMRDARDSSGGQLPDAERLTGFGRFLRRTRLDELPGLWNVVRGDMSLVGPRPLLPETVAAMGEAGTARATVRPGLTGWAQVNGNAKLADGDKLALDLWYIDRRSLWLDLQIIARTVLVVLLGERIGSHNIERGHARTADRLG